MKQGADHIVKHQQSEADTRYLSTDEAGRDGMHMKMNYDAVELFDYT